MTQWTRVLFPLGLGIAAFALNAWTMARAVQPHHFTAVSGDLEAGDVIELSMLVPFELSGQYERLKDVLIPWSRRSLLTGTRFRRELSAGDLVFQQDVDFGVSSTLAGEVQITVPIRAGSFEASLIDPGDTVSFVFRSSDDGRTDTLGPFRVIAIGARTTAFSDGQRYGRAQSLTVAVDRKSPLKTRLEQTLDRSAVQSVVFSKAEL